MDESAATSDRYRLQLFVVGDEPNSRRARENLARICRDRIPGRCDIEIIDVLQDFQKALASNVMVAPTLIVVEPEPAVRVIGDLSDEAGVEAALRLSRGAS